MKRKALIAWGGWEGHTPERSVNVAHDMLNGHGLPWQVKELAGPVEF